MTGVYSREGGVRLMIMMKTDRGSSTERKRCEDTRVVNNSQ